MEETENELETSDDEPRRARRSRRTTRGFLFPVDQGGDFATLRARGITHGRARRKRRRRGGSAGISKAEVVLGFCMVWVLMTSIVVMLELASDSAFLFVGHESAPVLDSESFVVGNRAYLPDGKVVDLNAPLAAQQEADEQSEETSPIAHTRAVVHWLRVAVVGAGVPLILLIFMYFAMLARRRKLEED